MIFWFFFPRRDGALSWQQNAGGGPPGHQGAQQQLSVVTTVWGVTSGTPSGSPMLHNTFSGNNNTSTSMANAAYALQPPNLYQNNGSMGKPPSYPQSGPPQYRQPSPGYNV